MTIVMAVTMLSSYLASIVALLGKFNSNNTQSSWAIETAGVLTGADDLLVAIPITATDGNTYGQTSGGGVIPSGTARILAVVFDGTQGGNANRLKLYVDGVQKTLTFNGTIPASIVSGTTSNIALAASSDAARFANMLCSGVLIYNRALSASEIAQLYQDPFRLYRPRSRDWMSVAPPSGVHPGPRFLPTLPMGAGIFYGAAKVLRDNPVTTRRFFGRWVW